MKRIILFLVVFFLSTALWAQTANILGYQTYDKGLTNGLKVIVCEKPDANLAEIQLWYRVGSKDEKPGIRGMAHMFEHMMFRGSKNYPGEGDVFIDSINAMGGEVNAYTSFDCTVYHETVPANKIPGVFSMEADRMENLILNQKTLDIERQVVGEELRNGNSNWFRKVMSEVYDNLYANNHPYRVDVIGYLDTILMFTTAQCQAFYDQYYSPNNCVLVVVGNVQHDEIFKLAEQYFGTIKKSTPQLKPQSYYVNASSIRNEEYKVDFPVQLYAYMIPQPAVTDPDYYAFLLAKDLLFNNSNSIVREKIIDEQHLAYGLIQVNDDYAMYQSFCQIYIPMNAAPGNAKVKKLITQELLTAFDNEEGLDEEEIHDYLKHLEALQQLNAYSNMYLADLIGKAEIYYRDYRRWNEKLIQFKKMDAPTLKHMVKKYFTPDAIRVLNIKPEMN